MSNSNDQENFRLNARNVYLTYPRCEVPMQDMLEELSGIKPYLHYCICRELHQDGNPHLHVLLQYDRPVNIRRSNFYDVRGNHPNVQSARDIKAILKYIRKEGDYIEDWPTKRTYGEILKTAKDRNHFMELVKEDQPKDYVLSLEKLEYFAEKAFPRAPSPFQELPDKLPWILPEELNEWVTTEFPKKGI